MLSFYPQFWTQSFDFEGRTSRIDSVFELLHAPLEPAVIPSGVS